VILYLDTSSLVKLLLDEAGSLGVVEQVDEADVVITLSLTYTEACAALARRRRDVAPRQHGEAKRAFLGLWPAVLVYDVDDDLCRRAGELAEQYRLRAYDSLHLAAYEIIARESAPEPAIFSSADVALNRAAAAVARHLPRQVGDPAR
jgi:predicted nucleic acid-binding protein